MSRDDQKERSESVRQSILDTALEIGLAEGFEAVSIRKIISRMKYSTGVIYHHFQDKQEVIDAIEASETARLAAQIRAATDDSLDIVANMLAVFHRVMLLALEEPEKYNLIVLHKYSRSKQSKAPWIDYLAKLLERDMELGLIREMDPMRAAFSIWSSFLGFNLMISRQESLAMEEAEALFQTQACIILQGILPQTVQNIREGK